MTVTVTVTVSDRGALESGQDNIRKRVTTGAAECRGRGGFGLARPQRKVQGGLCIALLDRYQEGGRVCYVSQ